MFETMDWMIHAIKKMNIGNIELLFLAIELFQLYNNKKQISEDHHDFNKYISKNGTFKAEALACLFISSKVYNSDPVYIERFTRFR